MLKEFAFPLDGIPRSIRIISSWTRNTKTNITLAIIYNIQVLPKTTGIVPTLVTLCLPFPPASQPPNGPRMLSEEHMTLALSAVVQASAHGVVCRPATPHAEKPWDLGICCMWLVVAVDVPRGETPLGVVAGRDALSGNKTLAVAGLDWPSWG